MSVSFASWYQEFSLFSQIYFAGIIIIKWQKFIKFVVLVGDNFVKEIRTEFYSYRNLFRNLLLSNQKRHWLLCG